VYPLRKKIQEFFIVSFPLSLLGCKIKKKITIQEKIRSEKVKIVTYEVGEYQVSLIGYLRDHNGKNESRNKRPCIILCPGGGYRFHSKAESDPVALYYFALGVDVFTLHYSVGEHASDFAPLLELSESVRLVRNKAQELEIDPDKIAVMGFSAGGHLAASLAVLHHNEAFMRVSGIRDGSNKPNAALLCYSVITSGTYRHEGSIERVSGGKETLKKLFSLENHVTSDCPPIFIWATQTDQSVPVQNSLLLVNALVKEKVSVEFHLFPSGFHALAMCSDECAQPRESAEQWKALSVRWLSTLFAFQMV